MKNDVVPQDVEVLEREITNLLKRIEVADVTIRGWHQLGSYGMAFDTDQGEFILWDKGEGVADGSCVDQLPKVCPNGKQMRFAYKVVNSTKHGPTKTIQAIWRGQCKAQT